MLGQTSISIRISCTDDEIKLVGNQESTGNIQAQVYAGTPATATPTFPDFACVRQLISRIRSLVLGSLVVWLE